MSTTELRPRRRRGPVLLVAGALALTVLALDAAPWAAHDDSPAEPGSPTSTAAYASPAVLPAAARTTANVRQVQSDRSSATRASRSSVRPSAAPYRFASKRFNHWYAKRYMDYRYRWHAKQYRCLAVMWGKESAWNEKAHNGSSGAHGIPQAMPGSKMAKFGANWRNNPMTQIKWGLSYVRSVYGSPCRAWSFWKSHHWY